MPEPKRIGTAMIVDDGLFDRKCGQRVLERSGLVSNVVCFGYPDEALAFLSQSDRPEIDVIFLDINMPRLSGFEFLEKAVENCGDNFSKAVVIMLTTSLAPTDTDRAKKFAVVKDYFDKPLVPDHVPRACQLVEA